MLLRGGLRNELPYTLLWRGERGRKDRKADTYVENPPPPSVCCTNSYSFNYKIRSERMFQIDNVLTYNLDSRLGKKTKIRGSRCT